MGIQIREEEIVYCERHGIPVSATKKNRTRSTRISGAPAIECGILEDPMVEPPQDAYQRTVAPDDAPNKATYVSIEFKEGVPAALTEKKWTGCPSLKS